MRLTSPGDQRLRWVGGVYFADIDRHVVVSQGSDQQQGFRTTGFVPASGPNPTDLLYDDDFTSKVYAVFGQVAYDVMDNLELALALRYDSEDREVSNNVPTCADGGERCFAADAELRCGLGLPGAAALLHQPGVPDQPGARDVRHSRPQRDVRAAAAEGLGELER